MPGNTEIHYVISAKSCSSDEPPIVFPPFYKLLVPMSSSSGPQFGEQPFMNIVETAVGQDCRHVPGAEFASKKINDAVRIGKPEGGQPPAAEIVNQPSAGKLLFPRDSRQGNMLADDNEIGPVKAFRILPLEDVPAA